MFALHEGMIFPGDDLMPEIFEIVLTDDAVLNWFVPIFDYKRAVKPLRLLINAHRPVANRLLVALHLLGGDIRLSHEEIALLIGSSRESVTGAFGRLRGKRWVNTLPGHITVTTSGTTLARRIIAGTHRAR